MGNYDREYISEFTRFMDEFLKKHPHVVVDQHRGRAIYWDTPPVALDELKRVEEDSVPVDSYYYFGNPWPREPETPVKQQAQDSPKRRG